MTIRSRAVFAPDINSSRTPSGSIFGWRRRGKPWGQWIRGAPPTQVAKQPSISVGARWQPTSVKRAGQLRIVPQLIQM